MENATKALVIAASVLVAMLLISLAMGVFNKSEETLASIDLSEYEIQQFNSKFENYVGNKKNGAQVNALLNIVFNHNFANENKLLRLRVGLNGGGNMNTGKDISPNQKWLIMREQFHEREELPRVPTGKTYKVEAKYDSNTGLIYEMQVWEN